MKYFLSTQKIFSCHDDEHTSRMYMKTFLQHMVCPLGDRDTGDVKIPVFAPRRGGAKMAPKHTPATTVQGGGPKTTPQTDPPRGGGGYLNNRYFGGAYQGVGVKNFGPPGGVRNDPFWDPPQKRPFLTPPPKCAFSHTPWKTTKIHMLAPRHVHCTST